MTRVKLDNYMIKKGLFLLCKVLSCYVTWRMLHNRCFCFEGAGMAKGSSGRIVVEIDPELKQELYRALGEEGINMKQWFLGNVGQYLEERVQPSFPFVSSVSNSKKVRR